MKIDGTVVKGENHGIIITRWFSIFLTVTNLKKNDSGDLSQPKGMVGIGMGHI